MEEDPAGTRVHALGAAICLHEEARTAGDAAPRTCPVCALEDAGRTGLKTLRSVLAQEIRADASSVSGWREAGSTRALSVLGRLVLRTLRNAALPVRAQNALADAGRVFLAEREVIGADALEGVLVVFQRNRKLVLSAGVHSRLAVHRYVAQLDAGRAVRGGREAGSADALSKARYIRLELVFPAGGDAALAQQVQIASAGAGSLGCLGERVCARTPSIDWGLEVRAFCKTTISVDAQITGALARLFVSSQSVAALTPALPVDSSLIFRALSEALLPVEAQEALALAACSVAVQSKITRARALAAHWSLELWTRSCASISVDAHVFSALAGLPVLCEHVAVAAYTPAGRGGLVRRAPLDALLSVNAQIAAADATCAVFARREPRRARALSVFRSLTGRTLGNALGPVHAQVLGADAGALVLRKHVSVSASAVQQLRLRVQLHRRLVYVARLDTRRPV